MSHQDGSHQQQCSCGLMFPNMSATNVYVPRVSHSHPTATPGDSPRPAGRSGLGSYHITAFTLSPGACESLCVQFKSEVSISLSPVGLLKLSPAGLQSQILWGLIFLVPDPWVGEPHMGSLSLLWENLCDIIILYFVSHPPDKYEIWVYCKFVPHPRLIVVPSLCL